MRLRPCVYTHQRLLPPTCATLCSCAAAEEALFGEEHSHTRSSKSYLVQVLLYSDEHSQVWLRALSSLLLLLMMLSESQLKTRRERGFKNREINVRLRAH